MQFLAAEKDAERLRPTDVNVMSYPVRPWKGQTATGSIQLVGPHSLIATVAQYQPIAGNSCDSLLDNASVMAQIQVMPKFMRCKIASASHLLLKCFLPRVTQASASKADQLYGGVPDRMECFREADDLVASSS